LFDFVLIKFIFVFFINFIQQIRNQYYFCYRLISRTFAASDQKQKEPLH